MIYHVNYEVKKLPFEMVPNPMVSFEESALMASLAMGKNVLEIGTYKGLGTTNLLLTANHVTTIDVTTPPSTLADCQGPGECLPKNEIGSAIPDDLRRKCDIVLYDPNEPDGLKKLLSEVGRKFDLIVIDGDHSYHGCSTDYIQTYPHLASGGVVLFHDVWWDVNPQPVRGPMRLLDEVGGMILNGTHWGMPLNCLKSFVLREVR